MCADTRYYTIIRTDRFNRQDPLGRMCSVIPGALHHHLGGIYFCKEADIGHNVSFYSDEARWIAPITVPLDARVVHSFHSSKADKLFIGPFQPFEFFIQTPGTALSLVRRHASNIACIPEELRTPAMCMNAVSQDGTTIRHLSKECRTEDVCKAAVVNTHMALKYVNDPIHAHSLLSQNPMALRLLSDAFKTPELCWLAVMKSTEAFKYVNRENKTPELIEYALRADGTLLRYCTAPTAEMCLLAVEQNGCAIRFCPSVFVTPALCAVAVEQDYSALGYIRKSKHTPSLYAAAVRCSRGSTYYHGPLTYIQSQTEELCLAAICISPIAIHHVNVQTLNIVVAAVRQNKHLLQFAIDEFKTHPRVLASL